MSSEPVEGMDAKCACSTSPYTFSKWSRIPRVNLLKERGCSSGSRDLVLAKRRTARARSTSGPDMPPAHERLGEGALANAAGAPIAR
jgi:hypothetical protein